MLNNEHIELHTPYHENLTLPWVFQNCENTRDNLYNLVNRVRDPGRVLHPRLLFNNRNRNRVENNYLNLSICLLILLALVYNLISVYGNEDLINRIDYTIERLVFCIKILLCIILVILQILIILASIIMVISGEGEDIDIDNNDIELINNTIRYCFEGN